MFLTFSLPKSVTHLSLFFIGAAGSLLGTDLLPLKAPLIEHSAVALSNVMNAHEVRGGPAVEQGISDHFIADAASLSADSSTNSPETPEQVGGAGLLLGLAIGAGAVGVALSARKDRKPFNSGSISSGLTSYQSSIRIEQASRKLQKKLLRLLHDDRDTANRLLSQVKTKNPHRAVDWCVEKVIYDLERDRGSY